MLEPNRPKSKEAAYYLSALFDSTCSTEEDQFQHIKTLDEMVRFDVSAMPDSYKQQFLDLHQACPSDRVQNYLTRIIICRWCDDPAVQELFMKATSMHSGEHYCEGLLAHIRAYPKAVENPAIKKLASSACLFPFSVDSASSVTRVLYRWVEAEYAYKTGKSLTNVHLGHKPRNGNLIPDADARRILRSVCVLEGHLEKWQSLLELYKVDNQAISDSDRAALPVLRLEVLAYYLGENDLNDHQLPSIRNKIAADLFQVVTSHPENPSLTESDEELLAKQIEGVGAPAFDFMEELLLKNKIVFMDAVNTNFTDRQTLMFLYEFCQTYKAPINIALALPPNQAHYFRNYLDSPLSSTTLEPLPGEFGKEEYESFQSPLRLLDNLSNLNWVFCGNDSNLHEHGDLAYDQCIFRLKENISNEATLLVLGKLPFGFTAPLSKISLTYEDAPTETNRSLVQAFFKAQQQPPNTVVILDGNSRFDGDGPAMEEEIDLFCQRHSILTSVGFPLSKTILSSYRFEQLYNETYGEAYDLCVISRSRDNNRDSSQEDSPTPTLKKDPVNTA